MTELFHVRRNVLSDSRVTYEVIAGPQDNGGILVASYPVAYVADDLAILLNRITELYCAECSDRISREATWDLLFRIDALALFINGLAPVRS